MEARNLFSHIDFVTLNRVKPQEIYITNLCNDQLTPAPRGKRVFITEEHALKGLSHIEWLLEQYPTIEYVLTMSLQTNYWLQKLGFYGDDEKFIEEAQPRRKGFEDMSAPFYQPVNGKAFESICGNIYNAKNHPVKVIPILAAKDYPLKGRNELYTEAYEKIRNYFRKS